MVSKVSLAFPQCVVVSAPRILLLCLALLAVFSMCFENFSFGSRVRPRILGSLTVGRVWFPIVSDRVLLYSAGSGLNRVVVVLSGFSVSWLVVVQSFISSR